MIKECHKLWNPATSNKQLDTSLECIQLKAQIEVIYGQGHHVSETKIVNSITENNAQCTHFSRNATNNFLGWREK